MHQLDGSTSGGGKTKIHIAHDGTGFSLEQRHICVHLQNGEQLFFRYTKSNGTMCIEIPFRYDLDILASLIKKGWFRRKCEGVHVETLLRTNEGSDLLCYVPS